MWGLVLARVKSRQCYRSSLVRIVGQVKDFFASNTITKSIDTGVCEHLRMEMKTFAPGPQQSAVHPNSCSFPENRYGD